MIKMSSLYLYKPVNIHCFIIDRSIWLFNELIVYVDVIVTFI